MASRVLVLCVALNLAPVATAQVIHVPGDYPDPQSAIAGASANAVIVVDGGAWPPIVIDKPLTLIGVDDAIFLAGGPPPVAQSPITLAGSGTGTVRLAQIHVGASVDGSIYTACGPSISGGGFQALHVFDSVVQGSYWVSVFHFAYPGSDGIDVDVPFTWVERCTVRGSPADVDDNFAYTDCPDAGDGLVSTGTVVALDCEVNGSYAPVVLYDSGGAGLCPPICPGGAGGDSFACAKLMLSGTAYGAGTGSVWYQDAPGGFPCCQGPDGQFIAASVVEFPDDLFGTGSAHLGQPWTVGWNLGWPVALLFVSAGVAPAPQLGNPNLYLPLPHYLGVLFPGAFQIDTVVPADVSLTGLEYGVQLYTVAGWTRPMAGVILP